MDNKIIQVALDGLENILKVGESDKEANGGTNLYAQFVEEAGGMITIHNLQHHENLEIYKKCFYIMDKYFPEDDEAEVDTAQVNEAGGVSYLRPWREAMCPPEANDCFARSLPSIPMFVHQTVDSTSTCSRILPLPRPNCLWLWYFFNVCFRTFLHQHTTRLRHQPY